MQKVYSVGQINSYIKNMFTQDFVLNRIRIRGEVSNCKYHTSGHIYFSLKDAAGALSCVMFASARKGLAFRLSDGQQVVVSGSVNVYERDGKYQLYASDIRLDGAGLLYEQYLALKQELEDMGMFAAEYKQPIPSFVMRLGVVTAPTGAAVRDIINISKRRNPGIQIVLYPARVQGEGAAQSIADGLRALDGQGLDVIIVGRGGGSIEDLWAFNEETVARAIFACSTPVISAVGHETDTTIADFVADLRAPTPSAAAELAVPDAAAAAERLQAQRRRLERLLESRIDDCRARLAQYRIRLGYGAPVYRIREQKQRLAELEEALGRELARLLAERSRQAFDLEARLERCMTDTLEERRRRMALYAQKLKSASPLERLAQGYAWVADSQGMRIHSVEQVEQGSFINIYVSDGCIEASVAGIQKPEQL